MKSGIRVAVLFLFVAAMAAGCAPTNVQQESTTLTQLPRPDVIMVYDFAVSPTKSSSTRGSARS